MVLSKQITKKCASIEKKFLRNNFILYEDIMDELAKNKHYKTDYQKEMALEYFRQKNIMVIKHSDLRLTNISVDDPEIIALNLSVNDIIELDRLITVANRDQLKIDNFTINATFKNINSAALVRYLIRHNLYELADPFTSDEDNDTTYDYNEKIQKDLNIAPIDTSSDSISDGENDLDTDRIEIDENLNDISDLVKIYLKEIGKFGTLTADQETELFLKYANGDMHARETIINHNLKLVVSVATRYRNFGLPFMDVIQFGNLGLMKAVEKFDITLGNKFSTYAVWWIKQSIMRGISTDSRQVRLPVHVTEQSMRISRARGALRDELHREPSNEELVKFINSHSEYLTASNKKITEFDVYCCLSLYNLDSVVYLDTPVNSADGDCDTCLGDYIPAEVVDPEEEATRTAISEALRSVLDEHLNEKQRFVIVSRFGLNGELPMTLEQVGEKMNITRERVRQIEAKALMKLRRSPRIRRVLSELNK